MEQLVEKITVRLKGEGFGVFSDINIKDLFKQKRMLSSGLIEYWVHVIPFSPTRQLLQKNR